MDFDEFVASRQRSLLRLAFLLCGDTQQAEDLVQTAWTKTFRHWRKVTESSSPDAYVRRMLVNGHLDWGRRRSSSERPTGQVDRAVGWTADHADSIVRRAWLLAALEQLPRRQRTILVLGYFEDLDDAGTAALLGIAATTVRSQRSRALARLRDLLPASEHLDT